MPLSASMATTGTTLEKTMEELISLVSEYSELYDTSSPANKGMKETRSGGTEAERNGVYLISYLS